MNNSHDIPGSDSKPDHYPLASAEAVVKHGHPPTQKRRTPPQQYLSPVTTTGKKVKESYGGKPDACSMKDKENINYQTLIPQQQTTDQGDYQSLTKRTLRKEYYNVPPALSPKPEAKSKK